MLPASPEHPILFLDAIPEPARRTRTSGREGATPARAAEHREHRESESQRKSVGDSKGFGRGSWIRTNDLQYPKLPRYQAALYPEGQRKHFRYTLAAQPARRRRRFSDQHRTNGA